jgi:hypothetical protein
MHKLPARARISALGHLWTFGHVFKAETLPTRLKHFLLKQALRNCLE